MIKIVVMICHLMHAPLQCTESTAMAMIFADTDQNDGTPCIPLGRALMAKLGINIKPEDMAKVACQKDGKPYY